MRFRSNSFSGNVPNGSSMKPNIHPAWGVVLGTFLFCAALHLPLQAKDKPDPSPQPTAEALTKIREKSLALLHDIVPASTSVGEMKTVESAGGLVYFGRLFDSREIVALVNLAAEKPKMDPEQDAAYFEPETWACHLSLCAWEKDHWVFRQYLDNAKNLEFHDRKDKPHHFVQASRKTGRYNGDHLSWYYDPKTKKLVRTYFETWGPFHLMGNYLCTLRGFQRRAMDETIWIYPYKDGKKGHLLAKYDADVGNGEITNFAITFRDDKKYWTYSFCAKETVPPCLHYTVNAEPGVENVNIDTQKATVSTQAEIELSEEDGSIDQFLFERLTGLSRALLNHEEGESSLWKETLPKPAPLPPPKLKVTGDPEIVRHLQNQ